MREILKNVYVNVLMKEKNGYILFNDSNLFLDNGRALIANLIIGATLISDSSKYVCDLGNGTSTPQPDDVDLVSYIAAASVAVNTPSYPIILAGTLTGVHFNFDYTNAGADQTIKEIGLFYRPSSDDFPRRGSDPSTMKGTLLARLKTTAQSIVIGSGKNITIDWKIIF